MPKAGSTDSTIRRRVGMFVIALSIAIAGFVVMQQFDWPTGRDAGAEPAGTEIDSSKEVESLSGQSEISTAETWKIPPARPRDRSNRPLLELVGVFTRDGGQQTALITEDVGV